MELLINGFDHETLYACVIITLPHKYKYVSIERSKLVYGHVTHAYVPVFMSLRHGDCEFQDSWSYRASIRQARAT
jgi:hypothetical protein